MICFTDFKFEYNSYEDLIGCVSTSEEPIEFCFTNDDDLYKFIGYLVSNGVNISDIEDINPMQESDLSLKDLDDLPGGCNLIIDFSPENFQKYKSIIYEFSRKFNMATCNY